MREPKRKGEGRIGGNIRRGTGGVKVAEGEEREVEVAGDGSGGEKEVRGGVVGHRGGGKRMGWRWD